MNRSKIRQQKRKKDKQKTKTYNMTLEQIAEIKAKALDDAMRSVFVCTLGIPLIALRDEFGYGKKRLEKFTRKVMDIYDSVEGGYVTLEDLANAILKETGVDILEE